MWNFTAKYSTTVKKKKSYYLLRKFWSIFEALICFKFAILSLLNFNTELKTHNSETLSFSSRYRLCEVKLTLLNFTIPHLQKKLKNLKKIYHHQVHSIVNTTTPSHQTTIPSCLERSLTIWKLAIQHFYASLQLHQQIMSLHSIASLLPWLNHPRVFSTHARWLPCLHKPNLPSRRAINIQRFPSSQISSGLLRIMRKSVSKFG